MLQNEKLFQLFNSISDNSEIYRLSPSSSQHDLLHLVCSGIPILAVFQNLRWNSNKTSLTSFVSQHTCDRRIFGLIRSKSIINHTRHDQILRGPIRATNKRLSHPIQ